MQVAFPKSIVMPKRADVEFLDGLLQRVTRPIEYYDDQLREMVPSRELIMNGKVKFQMVEVERIERIIGKLAENNGVVMAPYNTNFGFTTAYYVSHVTPPFDLKDERAKMKNLLFFAEQHLPILPGDSAFSGGKWFDRLAKTFMKPYNLKLIGLTGRETPTNEYWRYTY